jgi:phosphatidate phosphatase LPIN
LHQKETNMQYFGRAIGSVSKTWNSINPATLSGAIDVIVVENEDGEMHCSPFHVRFGKFQLLRPSQKKVNVIVNGEVTDIPMKLSDEGEAFFVFETDGYVPKHLQTSPVISAASSPSESPRISPSGTNNEVLEYLDIGEGISDSNILNRKSSTSTDNSDNDNKPKVERLGSMSPIERAKSISMKLNIPSKVEANGDILLDMHGYKYDKKDIHDTDVLVKQLLQEEFGDDVDVKLMMNKDMEGNIRILTSESNISDSVASSNNNTPSPAPTPEHYEDNEFKNNNMPSLPTAKSSVDDITDNSNSEFDKLRPKSSSVSSFDDSINGKDESKQHHDVHFKTLRLSSEQLKCLSLNYGENDITYSVNNGKSIVTCKLFLWKRSTPIVISDIDGTITRSDALGHVLTMLGRDWTHEGVAKLFDDIEFNGYNIMYLTARSVGLADTTRSYLQGVEQNGYKLPMGPVILSPDRTIAALKREIVLKKPEVFKMACLNDIRTLYYPDTTNPLEHEMHHLSYDFNENESERCEQEEDEANEEEENKDFEDFNKEKEKENIVSYDKKSGETDISSDIDSDEFTDINTNTYSNKNDKGIIEDLKDLHLTSAVDETNTPFYAGFGNRITDAISYRSVGVPSSRIFTINPDGDVKMELLEMAGYKCSYVSIVELVDQFFPPVDLRIEKEYNSTNNDGIDNKSNVIIKKNTIDMSMSNARNKYTDFNYWRSPDIDLSLITDSEEEEKDTENSNFNFNDDIGVNINKNENNSDNENANSIIIETNAITNDKDKKNLFNVTTNLIISTNKRDVNEDDINNDKDDAKSIGSRFSFFMRSPLSSPSKRFDDDEKFIDRVQVNGKSEKIGSVEGFDYKDKNNSHLIDTDADGGGEYETDITHDIEGDEIVEDSDQSDSDYIYEESGEEDEESDEEEQESGEEREVGDDDEDVDVNGGKDKDKYRLQNLTNPTSDSSVDRSIIPTVVDKLSPNGSISEVNNAKVHGRFV